MATRIMQRASHLIRGFRQTLRCVSTTDSGDGVPVMAWNEWDPLEEIIVGRAEGQRVPTMHPDLRVL